MATSIEIQADLTELLRYMNDVQKRRSWRNALNKTARKVRKQAVADLKATGWKHAAKIARSIRANVSKRMKGFSVKITPSRNPKSYYTNRRGVGVALAQFIHTGTENRLHRGSSRPHGRGTYHTGGTRATAYMEGARNSTYPTALAELGSELEAAAKRAVERSIKRHYGVK